MGWMCWYEWGRGIERKPWSVPVCSEISQAVFAAYLNTSVSTVQKWEIGEKKPSGIALKLLNIVERNGLDVLV
jgi:putative transcriptional regulator